MGALPFVRSIEDFGNDVLRLVLQVRAMGPFLKCGDHRVGQTLPVEWCRRQGGIKRVTTISSTLFAGTCTRNEALNRDGSACPVRRWRSHLVAESLDER
jgi:hypothetical protein